MDTIGKRITRARTNLGLNQKELAKKANITEGSLSRYENDLREPKSDCICKLAQALDVSTDYLFGLADISNNKNTHQNTHKDIESIYQSIKEMLKQDDLMFYGKPATQEDVDNILRSMKVGILMSLHKSLDI